jgi:hypothetical protein
MTYARLMYAVLDELKRASTKFPNQSFPWGGGPSRFWMITGPLGVACNIQRAVVDAQRADGTSTWFDVIAEEFLEAGAETGRSKHPDDGPQAAHERLKAELIQTAAMCLRAVADLDKQRADGVKTSGGNESYALIGEGYRVDDNGHVVRREPLLPSGGKHSGACRCRACAEPEPPETFRVVDGSGATVMEHGIPASMNRVVEFDDDDLPPNAGSAD